MVSLKDIASACGVSTATVSKALNDHKDVGYETKARIRRIAKDMGYVPNFAAKALKTARTYNVGVLFMDDALSGLTHDYFAHVLDSFKRTVEDRGYDITFINSSKSHPRQLTYLEHARYRRFDGVVIACVNFEDPLVLELVNSEIPVVTIDHIFNNHIAVMSDNVKGMKELLTYIYERGHRKIAYIHGAPSGVTDARLASFHKTAQELGLSIPDAYIKEAAYRNTEGAYTATEEILKLSDRPTCIIYPDDFASFGGMAAIKDAGLSIPEDISVAGYDGIRIGRHMSPKLTTLKQDTEELGRIAAENLIDIIEKPRTTIIHTEVVGGTIFEGETVKSLN